MADLLAATDAVARWEAQACTLEAALAITTTQIDALSQMTTDDPGWNRLVSVARRTVDPWFATDWPDTFDPLLLVIPLCKRFDWHCAQCPVGQQQDARSCAHPEVPVSRLAEAARALDT